MVVELLDAPEHLARAVVLRGDAGIGKTALWLAGVEAAAAHGFRILSARPSEAETRFAYAGVGDLLGDAAGEILPELPPVQQRALEAALLLGDSELHVDGRAVAAAFLGALRLLADGGRLCLAVDDLQWLDTASLTALRYALGRLDEEPVATLLAVRGELPAWLPRTVGEGRLRTVDLAGLSIGAVHELLHLRLDAAFPRPTLVRLWETSGGNPFFALELANALQRRGGTLALGEELPVPASLDELLHVRLEGLGPAALEVVRAVAALADPNVAVVEAALDGHFDAGLAEALEARILELDCERLRFTHPLLRSAVVARHTPRRRRTLHARLAEVVPSAEERARHLALATAEPDAEVAANLDHAARIAQIRGAPAAAADLAEQAFRLTPPAATDEARRRLLEAAVLHGRAGDADRATALLEGALAAAAPGSERAGILAQLAHIQPTAQDSVALYREALSETEDDALQAEIHMNLASLMRFSDGVDRGCEHAELAVLAASRAGGTTLRCRALAAKGRLQFNAGRGVPSAEMDEARSLERALPDWPLEDGPTFVTGHQLWWSGDVDGARTLFEEVLRVVTAGNDARKEAEALWSLSFLEWRAGNWEAADLYAAASLDLQTQLGRTFPPGQLPAAVIAAHLGRVDDARARARGALVQAEAEEMRVAQSGHGWVLGFVELSLGDTSAALVQLRRSYALRLETGLRDPGMHLELGDLLEALIAVGELDETEGILAAWQEPADALDRAWSLAILARCRGLLLAARGDLDGAFASFERALAEHARSTDPFHHARTVLALGRTQRRAKKRAAARATLEDALARFEQLGAPLWAGQTRDELARIGGRAPSRDELTEAESRIAALVAEGRTNRDVAAALFLTEHSVETALTRVYRKLGVHSRAELTRLFAAKS